MAVADDVAGWIETNAAPASATVHAHRQPDTFGTRRPARRAGTPRVCGTDRVLDSNGGPNGPSAGRLLESTGSGKVRACPMSFGDNERFPDDTATVAIGVPAVTAPARSPSTGGCDGTVDPPFRSATVSASSPRAANLRRTTRLAAWRHWPRPTSVPVPGRGEAQSGGIEDYERFLEPPGGRVAGVGARSRPPAVGICCVVGDVRVPPKRTGRHYIVPLHVDIQARARRLGLIA